MVGIRPERRLASPVGTRERQPRAPRPPPPRRAPDLLRPGPSPLGPPGISALPAEPGRPATAGPPRRSVQRRSNAFDIDSAASGLSRRTQCLLTSPRTMISVIISLRTVMDGMRRNASSQSSTRPVSAVSIPNSARSRSRCPKLVSKSDERRVPCATLSDSFRNSRSSTSWISSAVHSPRR